MTGTSKTFTTSNNNVTVPRFRQPATGFTKAGATTLTISTTFDRNCGPAPIVSGGTFSPTGTTINATCYPNKTFRSATSGSWNVLSTWQQSTDNGTNWTTPTAIPLITDGSVTIQSGHTVTLTANAAANSLTVNGVLNLATFSLNGSTIFTLASGAILKISDVSNFPTGFTTINLSTGSTVEYNKTGNQTVSPRTYSNLAISGSGVKITNGVTVTGILSLQDNVSTSGVIVPNVASTIVRYKGTSTQYLSDNFILGNKIYSMIADNTANVIINSNFTLNNQLTINNGGIVTINPQKSLIVFGDIANATGASGIIIKASSTMANGSLIFHNTTDNPVQATVEMYSSASWNLANPEGERFNWQFFGIPVYQITASPTFNDAYIRKKLEAGTTPLNHWQQLQSGSTLQSFIGYQIAQSEATKYSIKGTLVNSNFNSGPLTITTGAAYPGQHLFANPYTAAIDIRQIEFGSSMEASVYLFNTGTFGQWSATPGTKTGGSPGQYTAVPKETAGLSDLPLQIPSMGSMLVRVEEIGVNAYISFNYYSATMKNTDLLRVPYIDENQNSKVSSTRIEVEGDNGADRMWIITKPSYKKDFDNGGDGYKQTGNALSPQIFAVDKAGKLQVNATNDMNNLVVAFQTGQDTKYQMKFIHENTEEHYSRIFLHDLVAKQVVDITENGSIYNFEASSTPAPVERFLLVSQPANLLPVSDENRINVFSAHNNIYVYNLSDLPAKAYLFDAAGRQLSQANLSAKGVAGLTGQQHTVLLLKVVLGDKTITQKIVVN